MVWRWDFCSAPAGHGDFSIRHATFPHATCFVYYAFPANMKQSIPFCLQGIMQSTVYPHVHTQQSNKAWSESRSGVNKRKTQICRPPPQSWPNAQACLSFHLERVQPANQPLALVDRGDGTFSAAAACRVRASFAAYIYSYLATVPATVVVMV
jgi:hypothetical protein